MKRPLKILSYISVLTILLFTSCSKSIIIEHDDLIIEYNEELYCRVNSQAEGAKNFNTTFQLSEYLETKRFKTNGFKLISHQERKLKNEELTGRENVIIGEFSENGVCLRKIISIKTYDEFQNLATFDVKYVNCGGHDIQLEKYANNNYNIKGSTDSISFWAFQGSSSASRSDWVIPVSPGYYNKNYLGMNHSDYGGGIPVSDIWRKDAGIAIGHVEMVPKEVSLPLDLDKYTEHANISVVKEFDFPYDFFVGDTLQTVKTFVSVHKGDYFVTLQNYSKLMQAKGIDFVDTEDAAFESIWCGWGYERTFTAEEIIGTLQKVKELGIKWAVIDDGFQIAEGDWSIDKKRFPGGEADMKKMVDVIHDHGLKAKLWWAPLAADPGSKVIDENPEILLINNGGAPQYITWWDSYYMSTASDATFEHTKEVVKMFMDEWGFDGLKMDGQHLNAMPGDYYWKRDIASPEESVEKVPEFFEMIYKTARDIKPHAVIENCPCGTCMSFYNMPFTNQTVSSDPESSWQIRHKGRTYKAIMPHTAYYGDHVELSDNGTDFASSFGIGAVLGTKFTWPKDNPNVKTSYLLTPEKEKEWKKWFDLYHKKMLSKEEYIGDLYDIGFDKPETHVIRKSDTLYYAFYADSWSGDVELRGLEYGKSYKVFDYVNNTEITNVSGKTPQISVEFNGYLLISVYE